MVNVERRNRVAVVRRNGEVVCVAWCKRGGGGVRCGSVCGVVCAWHCVCSVQRGVCVEGNVNVCRCVCATVLWAPQGGSSGDVGVVNVTSELSA